jgi:O-antigen/teichoic acid export membrane protein
MNLTHRSVRSSAWNLSLNFIQIIITFIRSVFLARWLPVELFGIYAYASSIVDLSLVIPRFGMDGAFLNRVPETEDEGETASIHFSLQTLFTFIWALALVIFGYFAFDSSTFFTLAVLVAASLSSQFAFTPRLILIRRVTHQRLASISLITSFLTLVVSLLLAHFGAGIWALLSLDILSALVLIIGLYIWNPVWKPRFAWKIKEIKYFLSFGQKTFIAVLLANALDRIDDIWTGYFLGEKPLAFYSKAYSFAQVPGNIIAAPIDAVIRGSYAELKHNRPSLSKAFCLSNEILIRSGFYLGGILSLIAPELIHLVLGDKWMPMLVPFQLMLIFTLLNPVKASVGSLFVAVGKPVTIIWARAVQLIIMLVGIFVLGYKYGNTGVALAVDVMLICGLILQLSLAREYVDFSWRKLFLVPGLALTAGFALFFLISGWLSISTDLESIIYKTVVFSAGFAIIYLGLEYKQITGVYLPMVVNAFKGKDIPES